MTRAPPSPSHSRASFNYPGQPRASPRPLVRSRAPASRHLTRIGLEYCRPVPISLRARTAPFSEIPGMNHLPITLFVPKDSAAAASNHRSALPSGNHRRVGRKPSFRPHGEPPAAKPCLAHPLPSLHT
jgi:hypothetical protein